MDIDISSVSWVLPVLTFLAGTVVPLVYKKLSFDGLVVKSLIDKVLPISFDENSKGKTNYYLMVLKYVNAKQQSFIVEEVNPIFDRSGDRGANKIASFAEIMEDGSPLKILSRHNSPHSVNIEPDKISLDLNPLPFLIKGQSDVTVAHLFKVLCSEGDRSSMVENKNEMIDVQIKVNGKFRSYGCKIQKL